MFILIRYLVIGYLVYWASRRLSRLFVGQANHQHRNPNQPRSAYDILGVSPGADADDIKAAYRQKISEYHPDKVAHLGDELQQLAKLKSEEINQAYSELA